ncbi:uncharacterized protein LOC134767065 [Penaeus indicus]|uniref:uncharacterized protein LOC134767065 n=1 Tax=Penaeus indicus TaxID=29960 RepID=UPI00300C5B3D
MISIPSNTISISHFPTQYPPHIFHQYNHTIPPQTSQHKTHTIHHTPSNTIPTPYPLHTPSNTIPTPYTTHPPALHPHHSPLTPPNTIPTPYTTYPPTQYPHYTHFTPPPTQYPHHTPHTHQHNTHTIPPSHLPTQYPHHTPHTLQHYTHTIPTSPPPTLSLRVTISKSPALTSAISLNPRTNLCCISPLLASY